MIRSHAFSPLLLLLVALVAPAACTGDDSTHAVGDGPARPAPAPAPAAQPAPAVDRRPDVLIVVIDTLNRDRLGLYGHDRATSPFLEEEARRGVLFEEVTASAPLTSPSVASLFTGLNPLRHGVTEHVPMLHFARANQTVTELFRDSGYQTLAVVTNTWLSPARAFDQGFLDFRHFPDGLPGREAAGLLLEGLEKVPEQTPFYAWLHLMDTHLPYAPDAELARRFDPDASASRPLEEFRTRSVSLAEIYFGNRYSPEEIEQARALYDAAVLTVDGVLRRTLERVRGLGRERPLLVVYTADHGEALCEHDLCFAHEFTVYEELMSVPLLLVAPELLPEGMRVSEPVRLVDLAPTLAELAELSGPAAAPDVDGQSLMPLVRHPDQVHEPRLALAESGPRRTDLDAGRRIHLDGNAGRWKMARLGRYKLIVVPHPDGDEVELYDLEADPGETSNVAAEHPQVVAALRAEIERWQAKRKGHPLEEDRAVAGDTSDEELERLRRLGYLE